MMNELLQGMEFAKQLRNQISKPGNNNNHSSSLSNNDDHQALYYLDKMLSSFDKTINIAKLIHINKVPQLESPHSLTISSPHSENSHPEFPPSKRRKSVMPKWTKNVKINNGRVISGIENALVDGYSWRKYGQKEILGAKYPRGYYRCTHRHTRNCVATKQVQKSDEDSSMYKITYRGEHTCVQGTQLMKAQQDTITPAQTKSSPQQPSSPQQQEIYIGLGPGGDLKVEPELKPENQAQLSQSLSFNSAYLQPDNIENFMLSFCTPLGSPTTSHSSYLPESPYPAPMAHTGLSVLTTEPDINEALSGPNSVTNSSGIGGGDFEFSFEEYINFEGNFSFDN
ncbi:hypothetical protein BVRB_1g003380 [Beta vulgaris subsp. vulgaris]|nr:hypothetical protein BVRB_1g003380 [Beta vulgaris subsp. vulgaris]